MSGSRARLAERLVTWLQHPLPHHLLSRIVHRVTRVRLVPFKNALIRGFSRLYDIDIGEAEGLAAEDYPTFNAFFTRGLRAGTRIMAPAGAVASPIDGAVHAHGTLEAGRMLQAKGAEFSAASLLADPSGAERYADGGFATLYLAPYDYHRIHMPLSGELRRMRYVPGRLFSVNGAAARLIPEVFARNERVVCEFDTEAGSMALVLVGALFVGSIETVWAGEITPGRPRRVTCWEYPACGERVRLHKGAELGRFNMGSTVVMLFERDRIRWDPSLQGGAPLRMGTAMATLQAGSSA